MVWNYSGNHHCGSCHTKIVLHYYKKNTITKADQSKNMCFCGKNKTKLCFGPSLVYFSFDHFSSYALIFTITTFLVMQSLSKLFYFPASMTCGGISHFLKLLSFFELLRSPTCCFERWWKRLADKKVESQERQDHIIKKIEFWIMLGVGRSFNQGVGVAVPIFFCSCRSWVEDRK